MNPLTIANMGMGATVGGGMLGIAGSLMSGYGQSAQLKYQAGIARMNAAVQRQNAQWALDAGESQALQSGRKTAQIVGQQRTQQAANNLNTNFGTTPMVRTSQEMVGQEEQGNIRLNAARRAYGHEIQAISDETSAKMYDKGAKNAVTSGWINAASSFLGTASSVSSKWIQANQYGIYGGNQPTELGEAVYYENPKGHGSSSAYDV